MNCRLTLVLGVVLSASMIAGFNSLAGDETPAGNAKKAKPRKRAGENEPADSKHRVPEAIARDRAIQMHSTMESTLHAMHRNYFHRERAMVPARAMQDVFEDIGRDSHVDVRWISVNTKAMSVDHEPETAFERQAARAIASGKESFELIEGGFYRRAGAIPLSAGCIGCHTTSFAPPSMTPRFAALAISIPLAAE
jgi:hypothetical protein